MRRDAAREKWVEAQVDAAMAQLRGTFAPLRGLGAFLRLMFEREWCLSEEIASLRERVLDLEWKGDP